MSACMKNKKGQAEENLQKPVVWRKSSKKRMASFKKVCEGVLNNDEMSQSLKISSLKSAMSEFSITEDPIRNFYDFGQIVGSGKYGVVRKATSKLSPDFTVAIKTIDLENLTSNYHSCISEVMTLKKVDHPNIVKIYEIFKDERNLYIVMEYWEGKELFDFVVENRKVEEKTASGIIKQLLKVIKYLNSLNLCHRDIKPENILIDPTNNCIKLIDFGLSTYFSEVEQLKTRLGTPYYVAPEVLMGDYSKECDIWSIGVITHILLTGCPPFQGESIPEIYHEILNEKLKLYRSDWANLSPESLDFVKNLLRKSPSKRLSPELALEHPFISQPGVNSNLKPKILQKLTRSNEGGYLRKKVFTILSTYIDNKVIQKWDEIFHSLDTEGKGEIKISEIIAKLHQAKAPKNKIAAIESRLEADLDKTIGYTDFLNSMVNMRREVKEEDIKKGKFVGEDLHPDLFHLDPPFIFCNLSFGNLSNYQFLLIMAIVFTQLDTDCSGKITANDLKSFINRRGDEDIHAETLFKEVDESQHQPTAPTTTCASERKDIGLNTFKNFILSEDDISDISESTFKFSVALPHKDSDSTNEDEFYMSKSDFMDQAINL